jgi:competence protein ComEC
VLARTWPTIVLLAGCVGLAGATIARPAVAACLVGATTLVIAAAREVDRRRVLLTAVAALLVGLGFGVLRVERMGRSVLVAELGQNAIARVVVTGTPRVGRYSIRVDGLVLRFGALRVHERVLLELPLGRAPPRGAVLDVRARPRRPRGPETGFDERAWLERQGVHVVLRAEGVRLVGRRGGIGGVADRLRAHALATLARGSSGERRALLAGIVLGDAGALPPDLQASFRRSGLTHLLAVSGQNVAITALGVVLALRVLGVGRVVGEGVAIVAVLAYALAVGWQPSVVRAAVAGCLASLAWMSARSSERWHAMTLGALVLLLWSPYAFLEPGFQLSFGAVAAIFVVVPRLQRMLEATPLGGRPAELTAVAAACGAITAPLVLLHFGAVPVWTVPANVLAEPAMPPLVSLSLLAVLVAPVAPPVATALAWLAGWCAAWIGGVARVVSALPGGEVRSWWALVAIVAATLAVVAVRRRPRHRRAGTALALGSFALVAVLGWWALQERPSWTPPVGLRVTALDVGQGDAILLETAQAAVLVDQGPPEGDAAGQLRRLGVRSLSAIVLTHPQRDHVGGAAAVLRRLRVGAVLDPGLDGSASPDEQAALAAAAQRGVKVVLARTGRVLQLGRLRLEVLWPDARGPPGEDPNLRATVVLARYGRIAVLLTADAESDVTLRLPLPRVHVLKVAHHGSSDTGLPELLRRVRPQVALISVGNGNAYGHPTPETLAALEAAPRLRTYRTDRDGPVTVETDGRSVTVTTGR